LWYLYPAPGTERTPAEADAEAERVRELVWAAVKSAGGARGPEAGADLVTQLAPVVKAADAAGAALRADLVSAGGPLTAEEDSAVRLVTAYLSGYVQGEAAAEEVKPPTPTLALAPFSTERAFNALRKSLTHTAPDEWTGHLVETGGAVLSVYKWGDLQVRIAPSASTLALWWPETAAHTLTKEQIHGMVNRYAGLRGVNYANVGAHLAAERPYKPWTFDELLPITGYKRPGGRLSRAQADEHRNAAKRELFAALVLCSDATVHGRDVLPGLDVVGMYAIHGHTFEPGSDVPATIALAPLGISVAWQNNGARRRLGLVRDHLALPDTTPGRWADALLAAIKTHWRVKVNKPECHHEVKDGRDVLVYPTITRRLLFELVQSDPPTPLDVLAGHNAARVPAYFDAAVDLLQGKGGKRYGKLPKHVSYWHGVPTRHRDKDGREPWPGVNEDGTTRRPRDVSARCRVGDTDVRGWRAAWLEQAQDVRPGGADLAELLELRALRAAGQAGLKRGK
jgi:hypothetical protein